MRSFDGLYVHISLVVTNGVSVRHTSTCIAVWVDGCKEISVENQLNHFHVDFIVYRPVNNIVRVLTLNEVHAERSINLLFLTRHRTFNLDLAVGAQGHGNLEVLIT